MVTNQKTFKVGTFNLYNLALPNQTFHRFLHYSNHDYELKTTWIAQQLERMQADIIGFQEVIHTEALLETIALAKGYEKMNLVVPETENYKSTVALACKFPILDYQIYTVFPPEAHFNVQGVNIPFERFSKPILSVRIKLTQKIICTLFVVHLKSKAPIIPGNCDPRDPAERARGQARALILRAAEATALRMILIETLKDTNHPVIVMGDVNDGGLAVTSQIITGDPPRKNERREYKKEAWDILLYSVKDIQERQSHGNYYYTHIHNGHYQSLDHILVSQEWIAHNPNRLGRVKYVSVFNDHLIDDTLSDEELPCWQSDHGQVVASFYLEDPKN
ncbi:Endonuclease/exonuclease/phosphatase [Gloeothece citriformis PCC 7424]|uniref:Endonuclease/exonuclease/phosphatase n=1 Tax=Gloeothece citriformis (strain PCC 7424) TaxID=65393 RepID=B7KJ82_GLOC7|nr:endonuclease/exonuclease/phosphatase family protein [Gloeothece citriformis]ACK72166.1 Endonuclease/exonuclease/phosphatase [Gloeothece citriformis PCC 7424]